MYKKIMLGKYASVMQKQQKLNPNNQYIYLMYHGQWKVERQIITFATEPHLLVQKNKANKKNEWDLKSCQDSLFHCD